MEMLSLLKPAHIAFALGALAMTPLHAAGDAERLGKDLTAVGGEVAGNKEGTIPAYTGRTEMTPGWSYGKFRGDFWAHKDDKPLFSIDASNLSNHAEKLSPGQIELLNATKGNRIDVYPTRRSCAVPDFVAENTKRNIATAKLNAGKTTVEEAVVPGIPFPIPESGIEAMLNSKMRYRGVAIDFPQVVGSLSPRQGSTDWLRAVTDFTYFFPWGAKGSKLLSSFDGVESRYYVTYISPSAIAGQAFSITVFLDKPGETFYYFPGQRRVRRMPTYAYDSPQIGWENQYLMDETSMWQGLYDRYEWKLVGKKEMYVPYNVFGAYNFKGKIEDYTRPGHLNPDTLRHELHRVWVVEASIKSGNRHISPKRRFYLDEDSWNIVAAEDYDAQDKLWKTKLGLLIPVWELGGTCDVAAFAQYNLVEGRYVADVHSTGAGKDNRWSAAPDGPRHNNNFYTSDNLRAISER